MATKKQREAYARWVLASDYVPLESPMAVKIRGRDQMQSGIRVDVARNVASRARPHPQSKVAAAALAQLEVAEKILNPPEGWSAPKAWPGERPLAVYAARS
jgi:hypothetical protein